MTASFHTQKSTSHSSAHMSRESKVSYLLKHDDSVNDHQIFISDRDKYLEDAKANTKNLTGRKMQTKAIENFWQEAVLNIKPDTTISDIENTFAKMNNHFGGGFHIAEVSLHRDEGVFVRTSYDIDTIRHDSKTLTWYDQDNNDISNEVIAFAPNRDIFYNEDDKQWYFDSKYQEKADTENLQEYVNNHAHVIWTKYEIDTGKNIRLQKADMQKIQDLTAEGLQMERGERNSKAERMNHHQLKDKLGKINDVKYNYRDMQKQITSLENLASDKKKELHRLNSAVKNGKVEISQLQVKLNDYQFENTKLHTELEDKDKEIEELKQQLSKETAARQKYQKALQEICPDCKNADQVVDKVEEYKKTVQSLTEQKELAEKQANMYLGLSESKNEEIKELNDTLKRSESALETLNAIQVELYGAKDVLSPEELLNDIKAMKNSINTEEEVTKEEVSYYPELS